MNVHFVVDGRALCGPKVNNTGVHGHWHWMCLKHDDELTRCPECVELEHGHGRSPHRQNLAKQPRVTNRLMTGVKDDNSG